ncbi:hypothetical protein CTI12_AA384620 [Artemisia annua]|uniref:Uncharacterized protein n=1 Tax=Artemisia annua TaxID=35608 RepID=A0A2U1MF66_ARTAN|nr:hypothetical protein CTI12_AA384620 [Artemisia annua]
MVEPPSSPLLTPWAHVGSADQTHAQNTFFTMDTGEVMEADQTCFESTFSATDTYLILENDQLTPEAPSPPLTRSHGSRSKHLLKLPKQVSTNHTCVSHDLKSKKTI